MGQQQGLEKLNVWRRAMDFAVWVCKNVVPLLPADERFALASQLRRSVQSIPANIAEGYGRFYYQDNIRFCYIARGSLEEMRSHLEFAREMDYLPAQVNARGFEEMETVRKLISGYITYLKTNRPGSQEPGASIHEKPSDYIITGDVVDSFDFE
jgi:four helix bundle protein